MPTTYEKPGKEVKAVIDDVAKRWHPGLLIAGTKICVLMATAGRNKRGIKTGPAVKLHGVACLAKIKAIPYQQRAAGREDVEIVIDDEAWQGMSDDKRLALIDHELTHLVQKTARKTGNPKQDDLGRPVFGMMHHDHDYGWFDQVARRHADASFEVQQAKAFADQQGQLYFGWQKPPGREVESLPAKTPSLSKATLAAGKKLKDMGVSVVGTPQGDVAKAAAAAMA